MALAQSSGVTFRATSNEVEATQVQGELTQLTEAISGNAAFQRAFAKKERQERVSPLRKRVSPLRKMPHTIPKIIQTSHADKPVREARYGLVSACLDAYNKHHNLVLRPDDVWQAILTQFSFYVNANAEALRDSFVDFQGKKTLVITMGGTLFSADFGNFANRMVDEQIATNLKDDDVTEWLLPKFTTTTSDDRVAASVTIMSTLQAYFEYVCRLRCGIPEVTLEGTPDDWRSLRMKIDRLPRYEVGGKPRVMAQWHALLAQVLDNFVLSSEGKHDLAFWDRICHRMGGGSGPSYLSGWVTVFACFKANGEWQGNLDLMGRGGEKPQWPRIDTNYIPVGTVSVPVLVDDNGVQYDTQMLAGQVAYDVGGDRGDTVRPRNDWCIAYEAEPKSEPRKYVAGEIRPAEGEGEECADRS